MTVGVTGRDHDTRPSGLACIGRVPWGTHVCHFYRSREDLVETLVPFFKSGLEANERCLWVTSSLLPAAEAREALTEAVAGLDARNAGGQIEILDAADWLPPDDPEAARATWLSRIEEARADGFEGLRVGVDASWLLARERDESTAFEKSLHDALHGRRAIAVCGYALQSCGSDQIMDVQRDHTFSIMRRGGAWDVFQSAATGLSGGEQIPTAVTTVVVPEASEIPVGRSHPANGHSVRFFDDDSYPSDSIAEFVGAALLEGSGGMVLARRSHFSRISNAMRRRGIDVPQLVETGQLVLRDAKQLSKSIAPEKTVRRGVFDQAVAGAVLGMLERYGRVRAYGEIVDVLAQEGKSDAAFELERLWNELIGERPIELMCGYRLSSFAAARSMPAFRNICLEHSMVEPARRDTEGSSRLIAELQQSTAALENELFHREHIERQHRRLRGAERVQRDKAQQVTEHLTRLQRFTSALSEAATTTGIARIVVSDLTTVFGADRALFAVAVANDSKLALLSHDVLAPDPGERFATMPADAPLPIAVAHATGTTEWLASPAEIAARYPALALESPDIHSIGCLSIGSGRQRLGAIELGYRNGNRATAEQRALLEDYAKQIALALDRALSYEEAEQARERAEAASRAKDEFLAMLGHELRNPLSPILTAVQLMQLRAGNVLVKERSIIERQVNHMVRLIDDLLDVSRIAGGKVQLKTAETELALVVANAIEIASPVLEERSHKLVTAVPVSGLRVDVDPSRLAQVIVNLMTNAARYTPSGGVIEIRAEVRRDRVALSVRDTGIGIEPELLPKVFDIFVQGKQASHRPQGGLGLGLAIARNLVEMHGGTLRAQSDGLGKGSTFTVELPLFGARAQGRTDVAGCPRRAGVQRKILVVDDNNDAATMLAEVLKSAGHLVRTAHDGPSALDLVSVFEPEVALVDLGLPLMDGYEVAHRMAAGIPGLKLIAVTGYGQESDQRRSKAAGFEAHLVKPVDFGQLLGIIDQLFVTAG